MRLGKIEKRVLNVLYEHEKKQKEKDKFLNSSLALRPRRIILSLVKSKFPTKREFRLTPNNEFYHLMFLMQVSKLPKKKMEETLEKDPMKNYYLAHKEARKKWNKETNSIYRAIDNLYTKHLVWRGEGYVVYGLTETGRRVISHKTSARQL